MRPEYEAIIAQTCATYASELNWHYINSSIHGMKTTEIISPQEVREWRLGQELEMLAQVAEGEIVKEDWEIIEALQTIYAMLFRNLSKTPMDHLETFHQTTLGRMLDAAYARTIRAGELYTITEAAREINMSRVYLNELANGGKVRVIWLNGKKMLPAEEVKRLKEERSGKEGSRKQRSKKE